MGRQLSLERYVAPGMDMIDRLHAQQHCRAVAPAVQPIHAPLALAEFGGVLDDVALLALLLGDRRLRVLQQAGHDGRAGPVSAYNVADCCVTGARCASACQGCTAMLLQSTAAHLLHAGLAAALALVAELVGVALLPVEVADRLLQLALLALLHMAIATWVAALQVAMALAAVSPSGREHGLAC